jgi:hypothetical protein
MMTPLYATKLHVTNGDIVARKLLDVGLEGAVLPWREMLHHGPIPSLDGTASSARLDEFNHTRAAFIASTGAGSTDDVLRVLNERDHILLDGTYKELVLWFEDDLFDRLLLCHIVKVLWERDVYFQIPITLVDCKGQLGIKTSTALAEMYEGRIQLDSEMVKVLVEFWDAFARSDWEYFQSVTSPLVSLAAKQTFDLKYESDGMTIFERRIVDIVGRTSPTTVQDVFRTMRREDREQFYMGDTAFNVIVGDLINRKNAPIATDSNASTVNLTTRLSMK